MPLARYFFFVGAALLALLFAADAYLPKLPAAELTHAAAGLSVIRIHSDRKWPERVVFDTTLASAAPPTTAMSETKASASKSVADVSAKVRVREVFAQLPLPPSNPAQLKPADPRKPEPKLQSKRKTAVRSHVGPPVMMVAQQPHVGLFGNNFW